MRKKRIISIIIIIIVVILGTKGFLMYNNRQQLCAGVIYDITEERSPEMEYIYNKNKYNIVTINIDSLSGKVKQDNNKFEKVPATIEELKSSPYFTKEKPEGEIIVEVLNLDYDVIKSFKVKAGEKTSKSMIIKSDGGYIINVKGNKFHGKYKLTGYNYDIF